MGNILDDIKNGVSNAWNDISSAGAPAVIAGAEKYAADQLNGMARENQVQAQAAVNQIVQSGGPSSGIMASISGTLSQIAQGTAVKQYGIYIVVGLIAGYFIVKKVL